MGHELGHVVQQKQGIVKKTSTVNGVSLNDDVNMERDADRMANLWRSSVKVDRPIQRKKDRTTVYASSVGGVVQRMVGMEFQVIRRHKDVRKSNGEPAGHGEELVSRN